MENEKIIIHAVIGNNNRLENVTSSSQTSHGLSQLLNEINRLKMNIKEGHNITQHGEISNNFYGNENLSEYKELIKIQNEEIRALKEVISLLKEELKHYKNKE